MDPNQQEPEDGKPKHIDLVFETLSSPTRSGWPIHGALSIRGGTSRSASLFSKEAARAELRPFVEHRAVSEARLGALDSSFSRLPDRLTRWDLVIRKLGENSPLTHRLIGRISGAMPAEEGATDQAHFETCHKSALCSLPNCEKYARHGRMFPPNVRLPIAGLIFSSTQAVKDFEAGLEGGLVVASDHDPIMRQIESSGISLHNGHVRADRIGAHRIGPEEKAQLLDLTFGLRTPTKPARFTKCEAHGVVHLYAYDEREIGDPVLAIRSYFDGRYLIEEALKAGYMSDEDGARLLGDLHRYNLPEGDQNNSLYMPSADGLDKLIVVVS